MEKIFKLKEKFKPIFYKKNGNTVIMWDYEPSVKEGSELPYGFCYQYIFPYRASQDEIDAFINDFYNQATQEKILSGLTYKGHMVWLSKENQMNYQAMFNLATQTNGANLPEIIKLGTENTPVFYTIDTVEEMIDFYTLMHKHIQDCLKEGWSKKEKIKQ